jgi:hypothetical protein
LAGGFLKKISELFQGTISRTRYFLFGISLLAVKTLLDWAIVKFVFEEPSHTYMTTLNSYYFLGDTFHSLESLMLGEGQWLFNLILLVMSFPFMVAGLSLTTQRLNALKIHPWVLIFFFIPYVQLLFFGFLLVVPSLDFGSGKKRQPLHGDWLSQRLPQNPFLAAIVSAFITSAFGGIMVLISTDLFRSYGGYLFVGLPFCLGFLSTLLYAPDHKVSFKEDVGIAAFSVFVMAFVMSVCYMEGVICILMAMPIAMVLAAFGVICARAIRKPYRNYKGTQLLLMLILLPSLMGFESAVGLKPTEWHVTSSVVIKAVPEKVWKTVIAFPDITEPKELIFKWGISYLTHATIEGRGVGAMRRCHFNTGDFLEPITQWDEPKVLGFGVISEPEPMTELSFYSGLRPPHLDGYFVSNRGQFKLTPLSDGSTLLEGTTWYTHAIWPETYWHLWSDEIIHRIHLRVLNHIKNVVESSSKV